jgi:pimeloyl-ACP methyl ester carboxylesterase
MDAGLGGWSLDWGLVQPEIAKFTRVCTYDRAGMGWSEASPEPRDAQHAVQDLHTLLTSSGEQGPFVLVGHSNGGLRMVLYASEYPQEVAGLILVDSTPSATEEERMAFLSPGEQQEYFSLNQEMESQTTSGGFDFFGLMRTLRPFGVSRLLADTMMQGSPYQYLSPEVQPAYQFGINQPARLATYIAETDQGHISTDQVHRVKTLGNIPLASITSTKFASFYDLPAQTGIPPRLLELSLKTLWLAEVEMSNLSSNSTIEPVERSGHYIQFDRPDAVIQVIQKMVKSLQDS